MFSALTFYRLFPATRRSLVHSVFRKPYVRNGRQYVTDSSKPSSAYSRFSPWSNQFAGSLRTRILIQSTLYAILMVGLSEAMGRLRVSIHSLPKYFAPSVEMHRRKTNQNLFKRVIMLHRKSSIWPYGTCKEFSPDQIRQRLILML